MRHGATARRMRHRGGGNPSQNQGPSQGNNRRGFQNKNKVFDSNGPDVRIRGTAFQIVEKYTALAKDATSAGDRVLAESYLQHAEHYQRMVIAWNEEFGEDTPASTATAENGYDAYEQPAGTSSQPMISDEDLGLPSSIIGTKPVQAQQRSVEEVA